MKQAWRVTRNVLAMGLAAAWLRGIMPAMARDMEGVFSRLEDFRDVLREAQWLMLPQKNAVELEAGHYWFVPENAEAEQFIWDLLLEQGVGARVVVSEDAVTRETVLENADGVELERLQAEEGYQPAWVLELLAETEGIMEGMTGADYDPSRVSVSVRLVPLLGEDGGTAKEKIPGNTPLDAESPVAGKAAPAFSFAPAWMPVWQPDRIYVDALAQPGGDGQSPATAFQTLQEGLDAAGDFQVVRVAAGYYSGPGNVNLRYHGKSVMLSSQDGAAATIMDGCAMPGSTGVIFDRNEGPLSILDGFTIMRCVSEQGGGAIVVSSASPTIQNCVFENNRALRGGGIYITGGAAPEIENCDVVGNAAQEDGGGICFENGATPHVRRSTIKNNTSGRDGAGIYGGG